MDVLEIIEKRRSVFPQQFNDEAIQTDELEKVLSAANWAPNHRKTEPWRFKILQNGGKLRFANFLVQKNTELEGETSAFKEKKIVSKFEQSHTVIAICVQKHPKGILPEWEEISAVAMAVQNMWLACTELNIGAYWSSPSLIKHVDEFFKLNPGEECLGFFYMGKFDGELAQGTRKSPIHHKIEYYKE